MWLQIYSGFFSRADRFGVGGLYSIKECVAMTKGKNQPILSALPVLAGGSLTIGLDIGYGVTKAVTDTASIALPSVVGHAREMKFRQEGLTAGAAGQEIQESAQVSGRLSDEV